jgi:hypothetical protein
MNKVSHVSVHQIHFSATSSLASIKNTYEETTRIAEQSLTVIYTSCLKQFQIYLLIYKHIQTYNQVLDQFSWTDSLLAFRYNQRH